MSVVMHGAPDPKNTFKYQGMRAWRSALVYGRVVGTRIRFAGAFWRMRLVLFSNLACRDRTSDMKFAGTPRSLGLTDSVARYREQCNVLRSET